LSPEYPGNNGLRDQILAIKWFEINLFYSGKPCLVFPWTINSFCKDHQLPIDRDNFSVVALNDASVKTPV